MSMHNLSLARAWRLLRAGGVVTLAIIVLVIMAGVSPLVGAVPGGFNYQRSVTMSDARPGATGVSYTVQFTVDASYTFSSLVFDVCENSPLVGQTCDAPTGFTMGGTPTVSAYTINGTNPGTWTASSQASGRVLIFKPTTGSSVSPGDVISITITNVTNPTPVESFYGRIISFSTSVPAYATTTSNPYEESGGVALATASGIGFVFQVPESLQFCVYKVTCGDTPAVVLGHGPNKVLDANQIDTDTAKFSIATNALSGVAVTAHGGPPAITGHTLAAINGGNGVQSVMAAGTEAFGFKVSPTSGDIFAAAAYADTGGNDYTFDNAMTPPSTAGAVITQQTTPGPINSNELTMTFAATASPVTPAGTYSTNIVLVANATF